MGLGRDSLQYSPRGAMAFRELSPGKIQILIPKVLTLDLFSVFYKQKEVEEVENDTISKKRLKMEDSATYIIRVQGCLEKIRVIEKY